MPPVFQERSFSFEEGQEIPRHTDGYPGGRRNLNLFHLEGWDTFSNEPYPLARDIGDLATAQLLQAARLRYLEETQPSSSSGGQTGIQDKVDIISPKSTNQLV